MASFASLVHQYLTIWIENSKLEKNVAENLKSFFEDIFSATLSINYYSILQTMHYNFVPEIWFQISLIVQMICKHGHTESPVWHPTRLPKTTGFQDRAFWIGGSEFEYHTPSLKKSFLLNHSNILPMEKLVGIQKDSVTRIILLFQWVVPKPLLH